MTPIRKLALVVALVAAGTAGASPAVTELEAEQLLPAPESDKPGPLAFRVAVQARCDDPAHSLSIAAMLGDTLTRWQPVEGDGAYELALAVPRRELVFEPATLCRRRPAESDALAVLPGAFAMQVFARCTADNGAVTQRDTSTSLSVRYACPTPADAEKDAAVGAN
jgi:hypothetical protein